MFSISRILALLATVLLIHAQPAPPELTAETNTVDVASTTNRGNTPLQDANSQTRSSRTRTRIRTHRHGSERVVFGSDFLLKTNETVEGLVVIGGNADIRGQVQGQMVVIGGRAKVSGEVEDQMVIVMGSAEITDTAQLGGQTVLIGGPFDIAEGARLAREKVEVGLGNVIPKVEWFKRWVFDCFIWGRLLSYDLAWPWIVVLGFVLIYFFCLILFPGAIKSTVKAIELRPVASICSGLLALVVAAPLTLLLVITVVGIFVIPFLKLALILAGVFGKVALICFLGRNILRSLSLNPDNAFLSFFGGAILLTFIYTVPIVGLLAYAVGSVFGLGAAIVALTASFKREESIVPPPGLLPVAGGVTSSPPLPGAGSSQFPEGTVPPLANIPNLDTVAALKPGDTLLLPRAGFWRRILAAILDLILLGVIFIPLVGRMFLLASVIYFVTMWTWKGTTIGSIVMGLKVLRTDGRPMNFTVALVRSLSSCFSALVLMLGFLWVAWDREKQGWHDKIAGTVVVRMPQDFALL